LARLRNREDGVRENSLELFAGIALLEKEYYEKLWTGPVDLMQFTIDLTMFPYSTNNDDALIISPLRVWAFLCRGRPENVKLLIDKYQILDVIEKRLSYGPVHYTSRWYQFIVDAMLDNPSLEPAYVSRIGKASRLIFWNSIYGTALRNDYYEVPAWWAVKAMLVNKALSQEVVEEFKTDLQLMANTSRSNPLLREICASLKRHYNLTIEPQTPIRDENQANQLKAAGNACYAQKKYQEAKELYYQGLSMLPIDYGVCKLGVDLHNNIAICALFLGEYDLVLRHTGVVLLHDPIQPKAMARRVSALEKMGDEYLVAIGLCWSYLCIESTSPNPAHVHSTNQIIEKLRLAHPLVFKSYYRP